MLFMFEENNSVNRSSQKAKYSHKFFIQWQLFLDQYSDTHHCSCFWIQICKAFSAMDYSEGETNVALISEFHFQNFHKLEVVCNADKSLYRIRFPLIHSVSVHGPTHTEIHKNMCVCDHFLHFCLTACHKKYYVLFLNYITEWFNL